MQTAILAAIYFVCGGIGGLVFAHGYNVKFHPVLSFLIGSAVSFIFAYLLFNNLAHNMGINIYVTAILDAITAPFLVMMLIGHLQN